MREQVACDEHIERAPARAARRVCRKRRGERVGSPWRATLARQAISKGRSGTAQRVAAFV